MRGLVLFAAAVAGLIVACYPVEQPQGGVASVSTVLPPWPAVVVHDTMRDSTGRVAPLRALAFGLSGDTLPIKPTFVVLDTGAHLAGAGDLLVGDSVRGAAPVQVVGSLGALQTPPQNIFVTVAPRTLRRVTPADPLTGHTDSALTFVPTADSTAGANQFTLTLSVVGGVGADTVVPGWVVTYAILHAPRSNTTTPAIVVMDNQPRAATADTTTTSGQTSRHLQLVFTRLADSLLAVGKRSDSVVVQVEAKFKGLQLAGSPARYVIPVRFKGFGTP